MTATTVDVSVLDALDFDPSWPCQLLEHGRRCAGDGPAAWRVFGWCPGCSRRVDMLICEAGRVRKTRSDMGGCGACGHCHNWAAVYTIVPIDGSTL